MAGDGSTQVWRLVAAAWAVSEDSGAPLAAVADRLAADLRDMVRLRDRVRTELAGIRATVLLLAGLPLAGLGLGAAMRLDPLRVLLHTAAGAACMVCGLTFELIGLAWSERQVRRASAWCR